MKRIALAALALVLGTSVAAAQSTFTPSEETTVVWTAVVCVAVSIVVHGITGSPLSRRVDEEHRKGIPQSPVSGPQKKRVSS